MALQFNNNNATLNNLVDIFIEIAKNHAQINSFGWGDQYEIGANTVENYPFLWVYGLPAVINDNWLTFSFRFIMMDLVDPDQSNELPVQSDAIQTLSDILFILRDGYGLDIKFGYQVTPFAEKYADRVAGWYVDAKIEVPKTWGACDAPYKDCVPNYDMGDPNTFPINTGNGCTSCAGEEIIRFVSGNTSIGVSDKYIVVDTSHGNVTLSADPTVIGKNTITVKKMGTDTNSVIISMTTGRIYADSGAQTTYSFAGPGSAVDLKSNATNIYLS